jgi:hypothetical protein
MHEARAGYAAIGNDMSGAGFALVCLALPPISARTIWSRRSSAGAPGQSVLAAAKDVHRSDHDGRRGDRNRTEAGRRVVHRHPDDMDMPAPVRGASRSGPNRPSRLAACRERFSGYIRGPKRH